MFAGLGEKPPVGIVLNAVQREPYKGIFATKKVPEFLNLSKPRKLTTAFLL